MGYKTAEAAERLVVSARTLLRVTKELDLEIPKNANGHYVFSDLDMKKMEKHLQNKGQKNDSVQKKLLELESRLQDYEDRLSRKADDVVLYQVLGHRQELEEIFEKIGYIEEQFAEMKEQLQGLNASRTAESTEQKKKFFPFVFKNISHK